MGKYSLPKKKGKKYCDELWRQLICLDFNDTCPICKSLNMEVTDAALNAHHLISRRVFKYRWDVDNGILLCPKHHEFGLYISAHTAPWGFEEWIAKHLPDKYEKWIANRKYLGENEKNVYKYEEIYHSLEKQYQERTGEYYKIKRINMYLLSQNKSQIMMAKKMQNKSISSLAQKYGVSQSAMKKFIELG